MQKKTPNNSSKHAILLLTDKDSPVILQQYNALKKAAGKSADVVIAFHQKELPLPTSIENTSPFLFTDKVLTELGFNPFEFNLVPGNNHFPLLKYYRENPEYDYFWIIEDDVRFNGDWKLFFDTFLPLPSDFISCGIRPWEDEPGWYWWSSLTHSSKKIPLVKRIASFNPIYRISNIALQFINHILLDGWCGHHEVLLPTLLKYGGYLITDFGGKGEYVLSGFENRFYLFGKQSKESSLLGSTMRFGPVFNEIGSELNKLYHPIKDFYPQNLDDSKIAVHRKKWLDYMDKISCPVIQNLAGDKLKEKMPVVLSKRIDNPENRRKVAYLEAFARTLSGIAPWINGEGGSGEEIALRDQYRIWSLKAIGNAVNPEAKDYLLWTGGQPLVDASYFALAFIRCPWLWENLDAEVKKNVIKALLLTRSTIPCYMNWILFSSMIEAFFCKYGYDFDSVRIEYGIREFANHWYVGDGMFSDGMQFHLDYYNSYVIHPFLTNIMDAVRNRTSAYSWFSPQLDKISKRYAEIQERLINSDGSFPATGRSVVYRGAAFHHLADMALRKQLPLTLKPAQVREALTAAINKTLESPYTFTEDGWLNIGLYGHQPDLANFYITTGSLYICTNIFLPLGLSVSDEFWVSPPEPWTARKIWNGENVSIDKALDI
jgi:hypothetical protein